MSKELEAFNKFCDSVNACVNSGGIARVDFQAKEQVEKALIDKEKQDILINVIKDVVEFGVFDEKVEQNEDGLTITQQIGIKAKREITKKEKELYRWFILNQCFPKELKALEIIKKCPFDLLEWAMTYDEVNGTCYYDLLKEVLL